jgi:ribA/ribD-fused uncharacterized protein
MRITKTNVFFWGSIFSQWSLETDNGDYQFKQNDIKFSSAEQYMMYNKAILFEDVEIAKKILSIRDVKKIKELGRKVKNFDSYIWDKYKYSIVVEATRLKFSQNKSLLKELMKHQDKIFVEASPKDKIWGIGLHWNDDRVLDKKNWQGENLLGKAITEVIQLLKD